MEDDGKQNREKALRELIGMAEHEGNRAREAREKFERLRDRIVDNIDFEDHQHKDAMCMNLESIFNYGHSAGEASETSIALREQMEVMHRMEKVASDRDKAMVEREERALAMSERQVKALETIVELQIKGR